jgi:hypothetical protein
MLSDIGHRRHGRDEEGDYTKHNARYADQKE